MIAYERTNKGRVRILSWRGAGANQAGSDADRWSALSPMDAGLPWLFCYGTPKKGKVKEKDYAIYGIAPHTGREQTA